MSAPPAPHTPPLPAGKRGKAWLAAWVARRCRRPRLSPAELRARDPRRIVIVRQHNQMGDMVCATPALRALREAFPRAEIALVCAPINVEVVRHNPHLDRVLVFAPGHWRRPWRLAAFLRELRSFRAELAVVLNSVSFSVTSAAIAVASGAPLIMGGDSRPYGWDISRHAYSLELPTRPEVDRHAVAHSLAPLAAVGFGTADLSTVVVPAPSERERAAALLADLPAGGELLVMHPGAGKRGNIWPAERFAEVADRAVSTGQRVLVLQGPADGEVVARLTAALATRERPNGTRHVTVAPRMRVGVCAALLARADRFLCNDTGLMHVAGAVGVPTLALFGPTEPDLWKPLSPLVVAVRAKDGRLDRLAVEPVWQALCSLPPRPQPVAG